VLVAISNSGLVAADGRSGMLADWVRRVKATNVKNFVVFALDEHTRNAMIMIDAPTHLVQPESLAIEGTHNHAASAQKFHILKQIVDLGYSVILSDTDVLVLRDPFDALHRDCDVEAQSDGYDDLTAYGRIDGDDDPSMGWSRYSQAWRIHALNSGLFYLRANHRTSALLESIHAHLQFKNDWDQTVFNMFTQRPLSTAHGEKTYAVTLRIMDIYKFMNSKTLFRHVRHDPVRRDAVPYMVHINYHANKQERLQAVEAHYLFKDSAALDAFPEGS
jgi:hypothetical protein